MKSPSPRSRSHHAFTKLPYLLSAISYLLISGPVCADDEDDWQADRWRDVETVAGAFVASGPFYKGGQACVITDKGLVYSTGRGSVVAPDGYYYRSGNLWVGPNGKMFSESGSGNNRYIWGSDGESAISGGRGYFTERGFSWPAYPSQTFKGVSSTMRRP
jgi:hypothetical protein